MLEFGLVILIGLIGGIAVGIQSPIAGAMGQKIGGTASSVIVHLSGLIASVIMLLFRGGEKSVIGILCPGICWEPEFSD